MAGFTCKYSVKSATSTSNVDQAGGLHIMAFVCVKNSRMPLTLHEHHGLEIQQGKRILNWLDVARVWIDCQRSE